MGGLLPYSGNNLRLSSRDIEATKRHDELLNAIRDNNWHASRHKDVAAFSEKLGSQAAMELETRFRKMILARLHFQHMPDRAETIPIAHTNTFGWLFENATSADGGDDHDDDEGHWSCFNDWLKERDSSIYWITGKPGSGKSTIMKFIYHHPRLLDLLTAWAGRASIIKAGFYFWNSGSAIQMSRLGLLQTLLYSCLSKHGELITSTFAERWSQFLAFGGGQDPFEWLELRRALKYIISQQSKKFFILIDGLDEFDGQPKEIIELVFELAQPNVKLCIASRPWLPFEDAFKQRPSLRMEDLTLSDIRVYVSEHFQGNEHYAHLEEYDSAAAHALIANVVSKASGVFLWIYLVVQSLIEGLSNADRMSDLQARLDALPSDLEGLFNFILDRLQPEYFRQACETFRLLRAYREPSHYSTGSSAWDECPTLLGLFFADEDDVKSGLRAPCSRLQVKEALGRAEVMRRRLNARCKGLLALPKPHQPGYQASKNPLFDRRITYLHRTARDFVESAAYWPIVLESSRRESFQANARLANAYLWLTKTHPLLYSQPKLSEDLNLRCIDFAIAIQKDNGVVQSTYLRECVIAYRNYYPAHGMGNLPPSLKLRLTPGLALYSIVELSRVKPGDQKIAATELEKRFNHLKSSPDMDLKQLQNMIDWCKASKSERVVRFLRTPTIPSHE
jgi:hypothetical protein